MTKRVRLDFSDVMLRVPNGAGEGPVIEQRDDIQAFLEKGVLEDDELQVYLDGFRDALYEEQQKLLNGSYLSYETDGAWKWLVDGFKSEHRDQVESVLTLLFGVFMKYGCGRRTTAGFEQVELFFPQVIPGRSTDDRAKATPFYRDTENPSVYVPVHRDLMYYITSYTNAIKRLGYFREGTEDYFAPDKLETEMHIRLAKRLLGDANAVPNPYSGLLESDGFGIRSLGLPDRQRWAINDLVLYVRDPMQLQDWRDLVFASSSGDMPETRKQHIMQLKLEDPDADVTPTIPESRYFKVDDMDSVKDLCQAINGIVFEYTSWVDDDATDDILQSFVSQWTVELIHMFCPMFMSFIGVQYLQRICVELQDDRYRDNTMLGTARAYFADPEFHVRALDEHGEPTLVRYKDMIKPSEERLVASFVEVFGSLFFSATTYISAFVGEQGSGKNFVREMATEIAGGHDHTYRIDGNHGKFSMSMLKPWTNILTVEDAGKGQIDVPSSFMDAALGGARGRVKETAIVEAKFGQPSQQLVTPMGCCYVRNDPTEDALKLEGRSRQEKAIACVQGTGGGRDRRVRLAPPLMVQVCHGTVNGTEECAQSGRRYKAFDREKARLELPYMMMVSWMATVLGDLCRDPIYGLVGSEGNDELDQLNRIYMSMRKNDIKDNVDQLVERCDRISIKNNVRRNAHTIEVTYGVPTSTLKNAFYKKHSKKLPSVPEEYGQPRPKQMLCRDCGRLYLGIKLTGNCNALVENVHSVATCADKNLLIERCAIDDVPCYQKLVMKNQVIMDVRLTDDARSVLL